MASSGLYLQAGMTAANVYADRLAQAALGPYYPLYKLGSYGLSRAETALLGGKNTGLKAGYVQLLTGDYIGLARNVLGLGGARVHTPLNEHGLSENAKAFWNGGGTQADLAGLMSLDPYGIPWLLSSWDVLGSVKLLQRRFIEAASGQGRDAAIARARQFIADPSSTHAFNANQLRVFEPIARWFRRA